MVCHRHKGVIDKEINQFKYLNIIIYDGTPIQ